MQCRELRELLDSYLAEELLVETNHEVLRHLEGCGECRAELEARTRLRAGLRNAFARSAALEMRPAFRGDVVARLRAGAPPAVRPPRRLPFGWLALAASLVLITAAAVYLFRGERPSALAVQAAGDHQNCAVKFRLAERPISLEKAAAFDPALARMETVPPDDVPTPAGLLHVAERHSCVFDSRRFGHVVLKIDGHLVSLLMTADAGASEDIPARDHELVWLPPVNGMSIASLHVPGHMVFVVSDLPDAPFRQVAGELANPASTLGALLGEMSAAFAD